DEAINWFERASSVGHAAAQLSLGLLHLNGQGVARDAVRAAELIGKAAHANHLEAMYLFGQLKRFGVGVRPDELEAEAWLDPDAAQAWFRRAADAGDAAALYNLGALHESGAMGSPDAALAEKWYRAAAEQGSAEACLRLGLLFAEGDPSRRDYAAAVESFQK